MAQSKRTRRAARRAATTILVSAHASAPADPRVTADQQRRRSGAAGAHSDSSVHRHAAAGRKSRMGSRRAQRSAAIRDWS